MDVWDAVKIVHGTFRPVSASGRGHYLGLARRRGSGLPRRAPTSPLPCPGTRTRTAVVAPWHATRTCTRTPLLVTWPLGLHRRCRRPTALARPLPPLHRVTDSARRDTPLLLAVAACARSPAHALPRRRVRLPPRARLGGAMSTWPLGSTHTLP